MVEKAHPRLFVIPSSKGLYSQAAYAIILRRGPSDWYHLIRWNMREDAFEEGAWFHGRIYEEKCDLSPDGQLFVYMCHGGAFRPGYTDSWTAVSRAPWLHAFALWPWGTTYGGGGRFIDNRRIILHGMHDEPHPDHPGRGLEVVPGKADYHRSTNEVDGADWSGYDHQNQLIYCREGKLYRRRKGKNSQDQEIADFDNLQPNPQPAPEWAKRPLQ
jgi:hypothetical protein